MRFFSIKKKYYVDVRCTPITLHIIYLPLEILTLLDLDRNLYLKLIYRGLIFISVAS